MNKKDTLLQTQMHKLPLGNAFTDSFIRNSGKEKIPTLNEFIKLNPFVKYETDHFRDFSFQDNLFNKKSQRWAKLKSFLLENGFTHDDWIMLVPKKQEAGKMVDDFTVLKKEQILSLPIKLICPGRSTYYMEISTVKDVLSSKVILKDEGYFIIQRKLKEYGFTEEDGEIMRLRSKKTKAYYEDLLVKNRHFTKEEAVQAVEIGLKAGWIHL